MSDKPKITYVPGVWVNPPSPSCKSAAVKFNINVADVEAFTECLREFAKKNEKTGKFQFRMTMLQGTKKDTNEVTHYLAVDTYDPTAKKSALPF